MPLVRFDLLCAGGQSPEPRPNMLCASCGHGSGVEHAFVTANAELYSPRCVNLHAVGSILLPLPMATLHVNDVGIAEA
jgi:hypothetical protein